MTDLSRPGPLTLGETAAGAMALGMVAGVAGAGLCFAPSELALRFALGMTGFIAVTVVVATAVAAWLRHRDGDLA